MTIKLNVNNVRARVLRKKIRRKKNEWENLQKMRYAL